MKLRRLLFLASMLACLPLIGCPSYSVHPLYSDHDAVVEPALEGTWVGPDSGDQEELTFKKIGDYEYSMAVFDPDLKISQTYKVHLVHLGGQLFMDLVFDQQTLNGATLNDPLGVLPMHVILKLKVSGDDLAYAALEDDAIKKQNPSAGAPLDYEISDGGLVVTAPTDALRRYISAHTEDAFSDFDHFKRKAKAPVRP
ncbi:MAG: hypothetical protein ACLPLR_11200 [Terriglobales bacterium]